MSNCCEASAEEIAVSERRYIELKLAQTSYPDVRVFPAQFTPLSKAGIAFSPSKPEHSYDVYFGYGPPPNDIGSPGDVYVDGVRGPETELKGILWARAPHMYCCDKASYYNGSDLLRSWEPYNPFDKDNKTSSHFRLLRHPSVERYLIGDSTNGIPIWVTKAVVPKSLGIEEFQPRDPIVSWKVFLCPHSSFFPAPSPMNLTRTETEILRRREVMENRGNNNSSGQDRQLQSQPHTNKKRRLSGPTIVIPPRRAPSLGPELQMTSTAPAIMRRPVSGVGQPILILDESLIDRTSSAYLPTSTGGGETSRTEAAPDSSCADDDQLTYPDHSDERSNNSVERLSRDSGALPAAEDAPDMQKLLSRFMAQFMKTHKDCCDREVNKLKRKLEEVERENIQKLEETKSQHKTEILQFEQRCTQLSQQLAKAESQNEMEVVHFKSAYQGLLEKLGEEQRKSESERAMLRQNLLDLANKL